mmetsp:Transcript_30913/g.82048  ORF Transcript_30913/g.82048 Transcript_30913/m.82048 type:complete len:105 (+) Transcript_30913:105-419(+)
MALDQTQQSKKRSTLCRLGRGNLNVVVIEKDTLGTTMGANCKEDAPRQYKDVDEAHGSTWSRNVAAAQTWSGLVRSDHEPGHTTARQRELPSVPPDQDQLSRPS